LAIDGGSGGWVAALIRGPSGAGKSDLALRCLALPAGPLWPSPICLVADDRTDVMLSGSGLYASAPASIAGLLEVRGIGIVAVPHIPSARLILVVDLAMPAKIHRFPAPESVAVTPPQHLPVAALPRIWLAPFESSAPQKLLLALTRTLRAGGPAGADAAKHHRLPEGL
jgi:HPr kinase/phosphorylase